MCFKSMASYLISGSILVWLCLQAFVYGVQRRELQALKKDRKLGLHVDTSSTTIQTELVPLTEGLVENTEQKYLLSKSGQLSFIKPYASDHYLNVKSSSFTKHWAIYRTRPNYYYGTKATINIWSVPNITYNEVSSAEIWVINVQETVQAGWHVYPNMYHDKETHFFTYWTADNYQKTGCYNLHCSGFILNNSSRLVPGNILQPTSKYGGNQYYITLKIYKDPQTGDWLLFEGSGNAKNFIGYWPKSLFTNLSDSATRIDWGGTISFNQPGASPPMGSGHFPSKVDGQAASFKNIQYVNDEGDLEDLLGSEYDYADKKDCYQVSPYVNSGEYGGLDEWVFYFGGPGGCNN